MSEKDASLRSFGAALGYYMMRKSLPASKDELRALLNQMKTMYGPTGIDMSLIDMELANLSESKPAPVAPPAVVEPKPKPAPIKKPVPATQPKPAPRPVSAPSTGFKIPANADLTRAWEYYEEVSSREITDHEKLELLKDMLRRFGEQGAGRINKELDRIRRRLE